MKKGQHVNDTEKQLLGNKKMVRRSPEVIFKNPKNRSQATCCVKHVFFIVAKYIVLSELEYCPHVIRNRKKGLAFTFLHI